MKHPKVEAVLKFLDDFKDRKALETEFRLSNVESWHYCKWLKNTGLVKVMRVPQNNGAAKNMYKRK